MEVLLLLSKRIIIFFLPSKVGIPRGEVGVVEILARFTSRPMSPLLYLLLASLNASSFNLFSAFWMLTLARLRISSSKSSVSFFQLCLLLESSKVFDLVIVSVIVQGDDLTGDPSNNLGGLSEGLGDLTGELSVIREMSADTLDFLGLFGVASSMEALRPLPLLLDDARVTVGASYSRDRDLSIGSIVRWIEGVLGR